MMTTYRDGIDVRFMAAEALLAQTFPNVPEFGRGVTGARHETFTIRREGQAHHVPAVPLKICDLLSGLYVPESTVTKTTAT